MNAVSFELTKFLSRKSTRLLLITSILFPAMVILVSHLNIIKDHVPEGSFVDNVAFGTIAYSQSFFFLPVWIIVFIGQELAGGHASRVVFTKSRNFYFASKLGYCGMVTVVFSVLGMAALIISIQASPFTYLSVGLSYYLSFLTQLVFSTLLFCALLMSLVFILRSPIITFVVYFAWTFIEGLLFSAISSIYEIELKWLPVHLIRMTYLRNGEVQLNNYYNPFAGNIISLIAPLGFAGVIVLISWRYFQKVSLQTLSD